MSGLLEPDNPSARYFAQAELLEKLRTAIDGLLADRVAQGRWKNQHAYSEKLWAVINKQGAPSKWVTLHAFHVLKAAAQGRWMLNRSQLSKSRLIVGAALIAVAVAIFVFDLGAYSTAGAIALGIVGLASIAAARRTA